ncbi:hypothetical protein B296_00020265 [Ensete ventricosum]|uniref:Uncharacterized protein n=1 Tax=Ensete ventricosum TaxID=4639 RepID=A0A426YLL7_ENSVE|nr:hypothetical protein B296_00020265 [Ensete ventricosum]
MTPKGVDGGEPDGVELLALATVTASFIPLEQCPGVPQMKYLLPGLVSVILVLWSVEVWMELLAEQAFVADVEGFAGSPCVVVHPTYPSLQVAHCVVGGGGGRSSCDKEDQKRYHTSHEKAAASWVDEVKDQKTSIEAHHLHSTVLFFLV